MAVTSAAHVTAAPPERESLSDWLDRQAGRLFILPAVILSGFLYPVETMPAFFRWLSLLDPVRHFLVIVRGIFLKGVGLEVLWPQATALAAWGLVVISLAVVRSRKTLD